ncbi:hypothetical protein TGAM01_v200449 [Trichoderma gamsii]|uniref:Uncharacterized protein n=1 Tax=Trichoderma gamsii TaxID=398673 RepID=A0A2P5A3E9_9HYPO|nr:hypothetical protein TGAM01_v200449 [Trichoderma gamsii]PON31029.1 hypothetical protein TGAM01_v200449 [Trichoderma gamsii]
MTDAAVSFRLILAPSARLETDMILVVCVCSAEKSGYFEGAVRIMDNRQNRRDRTKSNQYVSPCPAFITDGSSHRLAHIRADAEPFLSLAQLALLQGDGISRHIASARPGRAIGAPNSDMATGHCNHIAMPSCRASEGQSIDKLAAWGWYPVAKSPKTASVGPTGLKELVYATISETPASGKA